MNIIEFLMKNFYFVIIILFVLSRLFSKAGPQNKPAQMPDFGGGGQVNEPSPQASNADRRQPDRSDVQAEQRARRELERRTAEQHAVHEPSLNTLYASQASATDESLVSRPSVGRAGAAAAGSRLESAKPDRRVSVRAEDLRRAVVWSEVLGPPRAKRPFRK